MELTLHPLAKHCRVSGRAFVEGERVVSQLVREESGEIARHDVLATEAANYVAPPFVFCRWAVAYKAKRAEENPERTMKLTAENLFVTLADPAAEPNEENTPMLQFLALMLERKKVLKPRGMTPDKARQIYEHARTHQRYEIPAGVLDEAFFVKIQGQLDLLVGGPKKPVVAVEAEAEVKEAEAESKGTASATEGRDEATVEETNAVDAVEVVKAELGANEDATKSGAPAEEGDATATGTSDGGAKEAEGTSETDAASAAAVEPKRDGAE